MSSFSTTRSTFASTVSTIVTFLAGLVITGALTLNGVKIVPSYTVAVADSGYADYTSLSDAVAACPSSGCRIFVADGTYTETSVINITRSNTRIELSAGAVIQVNGLNVPTLVTATSGLSRITIEGGKWLQTNSWNQGTAFDLSNISNSWVMRTRVEGFGLVVKYGDTASTTFYNSIRDVQFFDDNNCVEYSGTQANNNLIDGMRCRLKSGFGGVGVKMVDARGITITASDIEPSGSATTTGILVDATSREIEINNTWIENNGTGLSIEAGATRVTVVGSSITSNTTDISDLGSATVYLNTSVTGQTLTKINTGTITTSSSSFTISGTNSQIFLQPSGATTVNLPTAASSRGRILAFKDILGTSGSSTNQITLDPNGSETIDGQLTKVIGISYGTATIVSDGSAWYTIGSQKMNERWITPYHWALQINGADQAFTAGTEICVLFGVQVDSYLSGLVFTSGATAIGNVKAGIFGPLVTEESGEGAPLLVESGTTSTVGTTSPQFLQWTPTLARAGRYYACLLADSSSNTYRRHLNGTQVSGWGISKAAAATVASGYQTTMTTPTLTGSALPALQILVAR